MSAPLCTFDLYNSIDKKISYSLLSLFRTNQFVVNILLLFYAAIVRMASFLVPVEQVNEVGGVLAVWVYQFVAPASTGGAIVALILVCFQALLVNIILSRHRMASELTLLPGMFYILLASCITEFLYLSPVLLATTFYLLAISELLDTYKKYSAAGEIFNIGLWIGLASLFYSSMIAFVLLAIVGLRSLRAFKFKEQLILFFGFMAPYFLAFVVFFLQDRSAYFFETQFVEGIRFLDYAFHNPPWMLYLKLGFFAFIILIVIFSFNNFLLKKNIQVQKNISLLYWGLLVALLAFTIQANAGMEHLLLTIPSLGVLLSFVFVKMSRPTAEAAHLILLSGIMLLQFYSWWGG